MTPRQQELVDAAIRLLDKAGPNGFTMRSLASEIGLSPMAAYKHFDSQRELQLALWQTCMAELGEVLRTTAERHMAAPGNALIEVCRAFIGYAMERPYRFELLFVHSFIREAWKEPDIDAMQQGIWGGVVGIVRAAQAAGAFRTDIAAGELAAAAYSQAHGAAYLIMTGRLGHLTGLSAEAVQTSALRIIGDGLRPAA